MLATRWAAVDAALAHAPSVCAVCRGWGRGRVCAACLGRFAARTTRCTRCALPLPLPATVCGTCTREPPPFDAALAAVDYASPWDRLVTAFKFHDAVDLARPFARAIAFAERARGAPRPSLVVPVPLAPTRLRGRGYNQAWEIARRVARLLGIAADPALVLRLRETVHQLALPPLARSGNVAGAFAVEPRRRHELAGRTVAIVDDVMTTASTAAEVARIVKQAGASRVEVWVFARTPRPEEA
ncbi:MAG TPA: ComF family protein [Caldimonas sp.]|nr:ComF family protein [Caldimonas sp.]